MSQDFKLRRIGIIGLGLMGTGIAQVAATAGYEVRTLDTEKTLVDRAVDRISKNLQTMIRKNIIQKTDGEAILASIEASTDLSLMGDLGKKSGRGFYDYSDREDPRPRDLVGF